MLSSLIITTIIWLIVYTHSFHFLLLGIMGVVLIVKQPPLLMINLSDVTQAENRFTDEVMIQVFIHITFSNFLLHALMYRLAFTWKL